MHEGISVSTAKRPFTKIIPLLLEVDSLLLLYPMFSGILNLQTQPLPMLPECLVLDEVYAFKSHDSDYICVIVDYLDKKIIDVLPSRHKNVLINYFMLIPREEREKWYYVKKKYQLN